MNATRRMTDQSKHKLLTRHHLVPCLVDACQRVSFGGSFFVCDDRNANAVLFVTSVVVPMIFRTPSSIDVVAWEAKEIVEGK